MITDPDLLSRATLPPPAQLPERVGFLSTRFFGTDGVSLEAAKWAHIFEGFGSTCYWMGGQLDTPSDRSLLDELAFFRHPEIVKLHSTLYGVTRRDRAVSDRIHEIKLHLKQSIYDFIGRFQIELLIPQNILAIPMHVPFGLAMAEVIAETGLPTIAHHHDFVWERERFTLNSVMDYLGAAFPPSLPRVEHVVINSMAQKELARRFGQPSTLIPNVLDFDTPPPPLDDFNRTFRREVGLNEDDIVVLQPTRIVARKGIEHAIEFVHLLKNPKAILLLSHPAGDEGDEYADVLKERIKEEGVRALDISEQVGETRGQTPDGRKQYTLFDIYPHADIVTYPSLYEGFGNAFLEAIYFGKPILVNEYAVFARDIAPLGFKTIEMSQIVTSHVVEKGRELLANPALVEEWARENYALGRKYFSYAVARRKLIARMASLFGEGR